MMVGDEESSLPTSHVPSEAPPPSPTPETLHRTPAAMSPRQEPLSVPHATVPPLAPPASARCASQDAASAQQLPPRGSQSARGAGGGDGSSVGAVPSAQQAAAEAMSTRELKEALSRKGVAHEHCLEKTELVALLARERVMRG